MCLLWGFGEVFLGGLGEEDLFLVESAKLAWSLSSPPGEPGELALELLSNK